jgi:recombination associated protein RdgC
LGSGKFPTRLGLTWSDRVSFVLTDKLQVKRLDFLETDKDEIEGEELSEVDAAERFDIDFAVMSGELAGLLKDLAAVLSSESAAGDWQVESRPVLRPQPSVS